MPALRFVVYDPPLPDFPYLAVMVSSDGEVTAIPFKTAAEAEQHNKTVAAEAQQNEDKLREGDS